MIRSAADPPSVAYLQCAALADALDAERSPEAILQLVNIAARIGAESHCYRFADGLIENQALRVAKALPERALPAGLVVPARAPRTRPQRTLHVASSVFDVGGHSKMIAEWAVRDRNTTHCLVTTQQEKAPPPALTKVIADTGGQVWVLGYHSTLVVRGQWLRTLAGHDFDSVMLHTAPNDPVPLVAFGQNGGPPVALVNHADHIFWMGGAVSDVLVNLRPVGARLSDARRFPPRSVTIPIPVSSLPISTDRADIRRRLGIPGDQQVLVSVGRALKFTPSDSHDFYRVARRLLSEHPEAHIYLLGPDDQHYQSANHGNLVPDRLHLLGPVTNPLDWLAAADVYLESFPFGSQTATLEAAAVGASVILALAPPIPLLAASDVALEGLVDNASTEDDYCDRVRAALDPRRSSDVTERLSKSVRTHHVDEHWLVWLQQVYDTLRSAAHAPRPLPNAVPQGTATDRAISEWLRSTTLGAPVARAADHILHASRFSRNAGEWAASLRLLRLSAEMGGLRSAHLKAAAKILGRRALRRVSEIDFPLFDHGLAPNSSR